MKAIFYDLETTGLNYDVHGIVEIACIMDEKLPDGNFKTVSEFHSFIKPVGKKIDDRALECNHITREQLETFPEPKQIAENFIDWVFQHRTKEETGEKVVLIGHNIKAFDNLFLKRFLLEQKDFGLLAFDTLFYCVDTLELVKELQGPRLPVKNRKLGTIAEHFKIELDKEKLHGAKYDCRITREVYYKLRALRLGKRG